MLKWQEECFLVFSMIMIAGEAPEKFAESQDTEEAPAIEEVQDAK